MIGLEQQHNSIETVYRLEPGIDEISINSAKFRALKAGMDNVY